MKRLLAACLALTFPAVAGAQTMYKCVLNGKTVYQDAKCPEEAKQKAIEAPAAGPVQLTPAQAAAASDNALEVVSGFRSCTDAYPEWGTQRQADYDAWRGRNAALVARIESEPTMHERYLDKMRAERYGTPERCAKVAALMRPEPSK